MGMKAVSFDWFKTLGHWPPISESVKQLSDRYDVAVNWDEFGEACGELFAQASDTDPKDHRPMEAMMSISRSFATFVEKVLPTVDEVLSQQMTLELLRIEHAAFGGSGARLYPETIEVLEELKSRGYKLVVVSNWDSPLDGLLTRLGIAHYFDAILASHDANVLSAKPDPRIFEIAMNRLDVDPDQIIHVGDTPEADIDGARNANIRAILIDRKGKFEGAHTEIIESLTELLEML